MPRSHFPELETLAPERLHYAFGANCYQHAVLDQEKIYIHVEPFMAELDSRFVDYITLVPGGLSLKFGDSAETIRQGLSQGTAIDGLIDCGQELKQRDACHTIALYFTECSDAGMPDFHFVKRNAHGWEDKTPMRDVRHYTDLPDDIDGYKFERYLLVPQGTKPHGLERLETETIIATSPGYGDIHFESATERNLLGPMGTPANRIFLMFNEGIAMHTGAKLILPMPYCPEFIKPQKKKPFDFLDFKEFPLKERDFSFYKSEPFSFK